MGKNYAFDIFDKREVLIYCNLTIFDLLNSSEKNYYKYVVIGFGRGVVISYRNSELHVKEQICKDNPKTSSEEIITKLETEVRRRIIRK